MVVQIFSWIVLGLALLALGAFGVTSIKEREWRAVLVTTLFVVFGLGPFALVLVLNFPGRQALLMVMLLFAGLVLVALLVPFGKKTSLQVTGPIPRLDERDALFHRFYRLKPGTEDFEAYYDEHQDKLDFDNKLRALPGLAEPGSKTFEPVSSNYHASMDSQLEYLNRFLDEDLEPLGTPPENFSSQELTWRTRQFARFLGADLVGCTRLNQSHVYSHVGRGSGAFGSPIDLSNHTHALVIAVRMSSEMVRRAPGLPALTETSFRYLQLANMAMVLARYINRLGYSARAHVDGNYRVMCVPIAVDAGLGELGRLGLLVTRNYGPRVRLAVVTTDLPLLPDKPKNFGVQEFCGICAKCATNCPSGSVDKGKKRQHRGVEKWRTEMDSCYRTWRKLGSDCGVCVKVCPYSHPDTFMHKLVRFVISTNPMARRLMLLADDIFYGRRPMKRPPSPPWFS